VKIYLVKGAHFVVKSMNMFTDAAVNNGTSKAIKGECKVQRLQQIRVTPTPRSEAKEHNHSIIVPQIQTTIRLIASATSSKLNGRHRGGALPFARGCSFGFGQ
jgi:hypothetical protein